MPYVITLWCGCRLSVSGVREGCVPLSRVVEERGRRCPDRRHGIGARLRLWEILPDTPSNEPWFEREAD